MTKIKNLLLSISITYLTDRYHGENWPPSPGKLVQALVAAGAQSTTSGELENYVNALRWLEESSAPEIFAPETEDVRVYTTSVPRNQGDKAISKKGINREYIRDQKDLKKHQARQLPNDTKNRTVHYLWKIPADDIDAHQKECDLIGQMTRKISHLGWGIDQAIGNLRFMSEIDFTNKQLIRYSPVDLPSSIKLETPMKGFVDELIDLYNKKKQRIQGKTIATFFRPTKYRKIPYRKERELNIDRHCCAFRLLPPSREKYGKTFSVRWQDAAKKVAPWVRHGCGKLMEREEMDQQWIDGFVLGHADKTNRLSYIPLPAIGHRYADGRIRRFLILEPFGGDGKAIETIEWGLSYQPLTDIDGRDVARIQSVKDKVVERYLTHSKTWATVTPMILHGQVYQRGKFSLRKVNKLILQALENSGYPQDLIVDFQFKQAPFFPGCGSARQMDVPQQFKPFHRYHVSVVFKNEVPGPIVAGIGRHYGLGLFAPFK